MVFIIHTSSSPPSLRAAATERGQGSDLTFLVSTEDQGFVWRIQVKRDHIRQLSHELGIATEFEGPGPTRPEPMGLPGSVHVFSAHADHGSQGVGRSVRGRRRQGSRGEGHNALERGKPDAVRADTSEMSAAFRVYTGSSSAACRATDGFLRRTAKTKATRPVPRRSRELGSGAVPVSPPTEANGRKLTSVPPPCELVTARPPLKPLLPTPPVPAPQPLPMVFVSMVTAPVFAKALPQPIVALLFRVMLASARIFPWKEVVVSRVAELPTFQNTPAPEPVLITFTTEPGEVMSVLGIWNTHAALALPRPLRVSGAPIKLLAPAGTV